MSRVPMGSSVGDGSTGRPLGPAFLARYGGIAPNQGIGAEMIAERWGFSRTQLDEFSLASHEKAAKAQADGAFDEEIAPVTTPDGAVVSADEGIRPGGTLEKLGSLKTPFKEDGVISAGNASQISDGAAALLVTTSEKARELGLTPLVRIHTTVMAGDDPVIMLTAPIPATQKVLARSGLSIDDIGVYEVNEAFAPVPLAWLADLGADPARLNPRGGRDRPRPPAGWLRRPDHDDAHPPDAGRRHPVRAADDVRGRRHGQRDGAGAAMTLRSSGAAPRPGAVPAVACRERVEVMPCGDPCTLRGLIRHDNASTVTNLSVAGQLPGVTDARVPAGQAGCAGSGARRR